MRLSGKKQTTVGLSLQCLFVHSEPGQIPSDDGSQRQPADGLLPIQCQSTILQSALLGSNYFHLRARPKLGEKSSRLSRPVWLRQDCRIKLSTLLFRPIRSSTAKREITVCWWWYQEEDRFVSYTTLPLCLLKDKQRLRHTCWEWKDNGGEDEGGEGTEKAVWIPRRPRYTTLWCETIRRGRWEEESGRECERTLTPDAPVYDLDGQYN